MPYRHVFGNLGVFITLVLLAGAPVSCKGDKPAQPLVGAAGGNLLNASLAPTLLRAELLFDGQVIASVSNANPTGGMTLIGTISASSGSHTLEFRVVEQTASPSTYDTIGVGVTLSNGATHYLADKREAVVTGGTISYTVQL